MTRETKWRIVLSMQVALYLIQAALFCFQLSLLGAHVSTLMSWAFLLMAWHMVECMAATRPKPEKAEAIVILRSDQANAVLSTCITVPDWMLGCSNRTFIWRVEQYVAEQPKNRCFAPDWKSADIGAILTHSNPWFRDM